MVLWASIALIKESKVKAILWEHSDLVPMMGHSCVLDVTSRFYIFLRVTEIELILWCLYKDKLKRHYWYTQIP